MSSVVRVPDKVHNEASRLAAFRGQQPGYLIAEAWQEYLSNHRTEFAADLEEAARLLRDGTLEQLAAFTSRNVDARAAAAAAELRDSTRQ
jgi:hypothetical protein